MKKLLVLYLFLLFSVFCFSEQDMLTLSRQQFQTIKSASMNLQKENEYLLKICDNLKLNLMLSTTDIETLQKIVNEQQRNLDKQKLLIQNSNQDMEKLNLSINNLEKINSNSQIQLQAFQQELQKAQSTSTKLEQDLKNSQTILEQLKIQLNKSKQTIEWNNKVTYIVTALAFGLGVFLGSR